MKREIYDRSGYIAKAGKLGRLKVLCHRVVTAGSTLSINLVGALRLSPLKRYLTLDTNVHLAAYFVPMRFVYTHDIYDNGTYTEWQEFIRNQTLHERGKDSGSATTLPTIDLTAGPSTTAPDYLGAVANSSTSPAFYNVGYNMIYNGWYVHPINGHKKPGTTGYDTLMKTISYSSNDDERRYGKVCLRLPEFWSTGMPADATMDQVYAGSGTLDLMDIRAVQAEFRDEIEKEWFATKYGDVLEQKWGAKGVPVTESEYKPECLMDQTTWLSGYDVDATATTAGGSTLGNYVGKSQGIVNFNIPPRYFAEHGCVWVVALLRFPTILQEQVDTLSNKTMTVENILGDPNVISSTRPEQLTGEDFTGDSLFSGVDFGYHPYGQEFRTGFSEIDSKFHDKEGFPFESIENITNYTQTYMDYSSGFLGTGRDYFTDDDLGHWNMIGKVEIEDRSPIPPATSSVFAGTSL